jgi:hypothetical protein
MAAAPGSQLAQLDNDYDTLQPNDYMAKMDIVHESDADEKEVYDNLDNEATKLRFRQYLTGIKLANYDDSAVWDECKE